MLVLGVVIWYLVPQRANVQTSSRKRHAPQKQPAQSGAGSFCHSCGEAAQPGDKFCRACGVELRSG